MFELVNDLSPSSEVIHIMLLLQSLLLLCFVLVLVPIITLFVLIAINTNNPNL